MISVGDHGMRKNKLRRNMPKIYMVLFTIIFIIISGRFLYIQASGQVSQVSLEKLAKEKRITSEVIPAERGTIYDINETPLAYDRPTYKLFAILSEDFTIDQNNPQHVEDIDKTSELLAPILDVDQSYIYEKLQNGKEKNKFQIEFGHVGKNLSQNQKEEIEDLQLPGLNFEQESLRYYPNGIFASHIIGFAQQDDDDESKIIGIDGIEKDKDDLLAGKDGHISYEQDGYLDKLLYPNESVSHPEDGADIYLTIDQKVQIILEDMLTEVEEEYEPDRISAVIMHAKTGEIIAMSNRPSYDPNHPENVQNWYNDAIATPFEPGSTMKIFTWAAAIDAGVYDGDETFKSGKYQVNPSVQPVHDHNHGEGWGKISFDEGFLRSSNVASSILAWEKLGPDKYLDYLKKFDLDKKTNIDLPGEKSGQLLYNWPIEKLTTSFGQGSTVTPIQQIKAASAIANKGKMLKPYVIKKMVDPNSDEVIEEGGQEVVGEPISEDTADQVLKLLEGVVNDEKGTGSIYQLDDYTVAGKTGTAEIPDPDGSGYLKGEENNIYTFLGMAPSEDPELIMYVSVSKPDLEDDENGHTPTSHIFNQVMENSLRYLNITPDKASATSYEKVTIPTIIDQRTEEVEQKLEKLGLEVTVVGDGKYIKQANVHEGDQLFNHEHVIIITDQPKMPDISGWSLRDVLQLAHLLQLNIEPIGNGYVIKQSIAEDIPIKEGDYLGVELSSPVKHNEAE